MSNMVYGQLVRYVGVQHPELAGCEGYIHSTGRDCFDETVVSVAWRGRYGTMKQYQATPMRSRDLKAIKRFSKGIAAV